MGDWPVGRPFVSAARAYRTTSDQSIPTATNTAIQFNAEAYDNDAIHESVTNPTRLTCTTAGLYLIIGMVEWDTSSGTGLRDVFVQLNGIVSGTRVAEVIQGTSPTGNHARQIVTTVASLVAGDYLELFAFQDSGGSLTVINRGQSPSLMMVRQD